MNRGQVEDEFAARKSGDRGGTVGQVELDDPVLAQRGQVLAPAAAEVVDDDDVGLVLEQPFDQVGPDEARAAGDEDGAAAVRAVEVLRICPQRHGH